MNNLKLLDSNENTQETVCQLIEMYFFDGLEENEIATVAETIKAYSTDTGTVILEEGAEDPRLCIPIESKINIFKLVATNEHIKVAQINSGEVIVGMGIIDGMIFSASAIASADSKILLTTQRDFEKLIEQDEAIELKLI